MYDVMATTRVGQGRRQRIRGKDHDDEGEAPDPASWSPDRHRTISAEETLDYLPALAAREPKGAYLFYDCQTDDVRLVLTILGEAERFGAVMANRLEVGSLLEEGGKAKGVRATDCLLYTSDAADE